MMYNKSTQRKVKKNSQLYMEEEYTLTERLLLLMAEVSDDIIISRSITLWLCDRLGDYTVRKNYQWAIRYIEDRRKTKQLRDAFFSLVRHGYFKRAISGNATICSFTPKALHRIALLQARTRKQRIKKLRDGRCLMVFFDIPEKMKRKRDGFRLYLKALNFEKWQQSIWVTPYNVENELKKYIRDISLQKFVEVLILNKIRWR